MKFLKKALPIVCTLFIITSIQGQNKDSEAVLSVMKTYKDALQSLTTEGTF